MSGHVVDMRSKRGYGIFAQCVGSSSNHPDCTDDDEMDILKMRILNHQVRLVLLVNCCTDLW
jgi:hypothetical protein